jgi:UDP-N-acetylmuramate dehydrogenase
MARFVEECSLKNHNSFGLDVKAWYYFEYTGVDELAEFLDSEKWIRNEKHLFIGSGSNVLFLHDFDGLVLHPGISRIEVVDEDSEHVWVEAGAGVKWDFFVEYCASHGWGGVENLSGIPGKIGAVPVQNIGAYGQEASAVIEMVNGFDLVEMADRQIPAPECRFGYRDSIFKHELQNRFLVNSVLFKLSKFPVFNLEYGLLKEEVEKSGKPDLKLVRQAIIDIRNSKLPDPVIIGNAGSFFKNPVVPVKHYEGLRTEYPGISGYAINSDCIKLAAGWLIEQCGWKGYRKGDAGVHYRQALVLVNHGNATGMEIFDLSEEIRKSVYDKFRVVLEREVICI